MQHQVQSHVRLRPGRGRNEPRWVFQQSSGTSAARLRKSACPAYKDPPTLDCALADGYGSKLDHRGPQVWSTFPFDRGPPFWGSPR